MIVITAYNLYSGCGYDRRVQWTAVIYLITQFLLFLNFYLKSYTRPGRGNGAKVKSDSRDVEDESLSSIDPEKNGVRLRATPKY